MSRYAMHKSTVMTSVKAIPDIAIIILYSEAVTVYRHGGLVAKASAS